MKLRIFALILAIAFIISGLYGCQSEDSAIEDASSIQSTNSSDDISDESSNISDTSGELPPPQPEPDYFTKNGQGELPQPAEIPESYIKTETDYLYALNLDLPSVDGFSCLVNGDILYLFYYEKTDQLCSVYSLTTGELLSCFDRPFWGSKGNLSDGGVWLLDYSNLKVEFVTPDGEKTVKYEESEPDEYYVSDAIITPDGKYALISYGTQTAPCVINIQSGVKFQPEQLSSVEIYSMEIYGDKIRLSISDRNVLYNPATDELTTVTESSGGGRFFGGLYISPAENSLILSSPIQDEKFFMPLGVYESVISIDFGYAVTEDYFDLRTHNFYNLRNGTLDISVTLSDDCYGSYVQFLNNGRALIIEHCSDGAFVYILDLPSAVNNTESTSVTSYLCTEQELQQKTKLLADKVYEDYGVELFYFSQGNDFLLYDYVGAVELNSFKVHLAVQETASILANYPQNMLRETYEDSHKGIHFYLCGALYGVGGDSISNAGAVTSEYNGYIIIAFDINDSLKYNIPHELSHAFDRRISYVYSQGGTDWMSVWESATPVKNAYTYTYDDYYKNMDYTFYGESREKKIWFVDAYSRTFPTEDRARIMEYLFNPEEGDLAAMLKTENLINKARLYCYILRQCYPSCNTEEPLYWETYLGTIDDSVLPAE